MLEKSSHSFVPQSVGRAGPIRTLVEVNSRVTEKSQSRPGHSDVPWYQMSVGESVFLPNCTANPRDTDPGMKLINASGYTRKNTIVWTVRSTEENGIKGLRIWRAA